VIEKNNRPHVALLFLKMMKRPVAVEELYELSTRFKKTRSCDTAVDALRRLETLGLAVRTQKGWQITPRGVREVYDISLRAERQPKH
jgi:hypothetical protein